MKCFLRGGYHIKVPLVKEAAVPCLNVKNVDLLLQGIFFLHGSCKCFSSIFIFLVWYIFYFYVSIKIRFGQ